MRLDLLLHGQGRGPHRQGPAELFDSGGSAHWNAESSGSNKGATAPTFAVTERCRVGAEGLSQGEMGMR